MTITRNTSHELYSNITTLIGVDSSNTVVDAVGTQTLTPNAGVVMGTGTWGKHFRTSISGGNAVGVAMSPGILTKSLTNPIKKGFIFIAINAGNSRSGTRGGTLDNLSAITPSVSSGETLGVSTAASGTPALLGTTDIIGTGAHSLCICYDGDGAGGFTDVYVDGVLENSGTGSGNASDSAYAVYIGGSASGGFGGFAADYVWLVKGNIRPTATQVLNLHNSLGPNNTFGPVSPPTPSAIITSTEANDISAISASVVPTATISYTEANDTAAITASVTITGVAGTISSTEANDTSAITASVTTPTITTGAFENNTGSVLANLTGLTVTVLNLTTFAFVKTFTNKTTDASGIMTLNDSLFVAGTQYAVVTANASGVLGVEKYTAA